MQVSSTTGSGTRKDARGVPVFPVGQMALFVHGDCAVFPLGDVEQPD